MDIDNKKWFQIRTSDRHTYFFPSMKSAERQARATARVYGVFVEIWQGDKVIAQVGADRFPRTRTRMRMYA